jgi:hypothetical protein
MAGRCGVLPAEGVAELVYLGEAKTTGGFLPVGWSEGETSPP